MRDTLQDGVRVITLAREPMNTLDRAAVDALSGQFANHPHDLPLVIEGAGSVFSAGVDARAFEGYSGPERLGLARAITQMTAHLLAIQAPVVAAMTGHALGGGLVLALCCDYRIAPNTPKAKFGLLEAKAGIAFPSGPARIVQSELPAPLLRQLTLSCNTLSASDLVQQYVFDELAEPDQVRALAYLKALELAALPGFRAVKAQIRGGLAADVRDLARLGQESAFGA